MVKIEEENVPEDPPITIKSSSLGGKPLPNYPLINKMLGKPGLPIYPPNTIHPLRPYLINGSSLSNPFYYKF